MDGILDDLFDFGKNLLTGGLRYGEDFVNAHDLMWPFKGRAAEPGPTPGPTPSPASPDRPPIPPPQRPKPPFPPGLRTGFRSHPTDSWAAAYESHPTDSWAAAYELFARVALEEDVTELLTYGGVQVCGRYGDYVLRQNGNVAFFIDGKLQATGCMVVQLEPGAGCVPGLDHMVANYLLLRADEKRYWLTAIVSPQNPTFRHPLGKDVT